MPPLSTPTDALGVATFSNVSVVGSSIPTVGVWKRWELVSSYSICEQLV